MGKHIDAESGQVIKPVRLVADESTPTKRFKNMGDGTWAEVQAAVCENITGKFREAFETYMAGTRWIESKGDGDLIYLDGNAAAAGNMAFGGLAMKPITIGAGSTTTRIATNLTESASDHWKDGTLCFISGTLTGQRTSITGYNGTTKELAVSALTQAPSNGDLAVIV